MGADLVGFGGDRCGFSQSIKQSDRGDMMIALQMVK